MGTYDTRGGSARHDRAYEGSDNRPADFYVEHGGDRFTLSSLRSALDYFRGRILDVDTVGPNTTRFRSAS